MGNVLTPSTKNNTPFDNIMKSIIADALVTQTSYGQMNDITMRGCCTGMGDNGVPASTTNP